MADWLTQNPHPHSSLLTVAFQTVQKKINIFDICDVPQSPTDMWSCFSLWLFLNLIKLTVRTNPHRCEARDHSSHFVTWQDKKLITAKQIDNNRHGKNSLNAEQ